MRLENALVLEQFAGELDGFGDGLHRHLAPPGPDNTFPRCAIGNLFQHLKDHDARSFESRLAMANLRVGNNVLAKFHKRGLAVNFSPHTADESLCLERSLCKQAVAGISVACTAELWTCARKDAASRFTASPR